MPRPHMTVVAVLSLALVACTSPQDQAADELAELEQILDDASFGDGEIEPAYLDLDPGGDNIVDLTDGLSYSFADFQRGVSSREEVAFVGFDITIDNTTGGPFNPEAVNLWFTTGAEGTEAEPVLDAEQGIGTIEEYSGEYAAFGATIGDQESVTIRFGYALEPDEERLEIRLQPWDVEEAGDVYLTGDIPTD